MIRKNLRSLLLVLAAAVFMAAAFAALVTSMELATQGTKGNFYHGREEMNYYDLAGVLSFAFGSACLVAALMLFRRRN